MERIRLRVDSCIVIYLVERHPLYEPLLREKLEGLEDATHVQVHHLRLRP